MYSTNEIAKLLGVCPATVRTWIRNGALKHIRIGGIIRVTDEHITAFTKANEGHNAA